MAQNVNDGTAESPIGASDPADYKVGYRKPPLATRFPRGTSGNPLGRPTSRRGTVTLVGAMRELLMSNVTVVVDGRRRRMLRVEALADALVTNAIAGNASAARLVLDLAHRVVPPDSTIADMNRALKHKPGLPPKPEDAYDHYTDEERARMSPEWLTRDMPDELLSGGRPSDGSPSSDEGPSDDSPSEDGPPADSKDT